MYDYLASLTKQLFKHIVGNRPLPEVPANDRLSLRPHSRTSGDTQTSQSDVDHGMAMNETGSQSNDDDSASSVSTISDTSTIQPPIMRDPSSSVTSSILPSSQTKSDAVTLMVLLQNDHDSFMTQVKKLIRKNKKKAAETFLTDVDGWTPFHAVALRGSKNALKVMTATGLDVNHRMGQPSGLAAGCTALHIAAHRGDPKIVEYLLSRGSLLNVKNSSHRHALYYALKAKNVQTSRLLINYGAVIDLSKLDAKSKLEYQAILESKQTLFSGVKTALKSRHS